MKHIPFGLALFVLLSAHKCNDKTVAAVGAETPAEAVQQLSSMMGTKLTLTAIKGGPLNMPAGSEAPWIMLVEEGAKVEGFGGCNTFFGEFAVEGEKIKFMNLGSTKKYCEATQGIESAFLTALRTSATFKLEGSVMKLFADGLEIASLVK